MLVDAGVQYDDVAVDVADWPTKKNELPFGSAPVLQWGDTIVAQTEAIAHFLSRKLGYYGRDNTPEWDARVDMVASALYQDIYNPLGLMFYFPLAQPTGDLKVQITAWKTRTLYLLGKINTLLGDDEYFSGRNDGHPSFADFFLFDTWDILLEYLPQHKLPETYPKLHGLYERIQNRPNIKKYLNSGKKFSTISLSPVEADVRNAVAASE